MFPGISTIEQLADRFLANPEDELVFGRYQQACLQWAKDNDLTHLESALAVAFDDVLARKEIVWLTLGMVRGAISVISIKQNKTDRSVFAAVVAAVISAGAILGASLLTNWDKISGKVRPSPPAKVPEVRIVMPTAPPPQRILVPMPAAAPQGAPSHAPRVQTPSAQATAIAPSPQAPVPAQLPSPQPIEEP